MSNPSEPANATAERSTVRLPPVTAPASASPLTGRALPTIGAQGRTRASGVALLLLGAVLLGFLAQFVGISQISYARSQQLQLDEFRFQLANSTAPIGQVGSNGRLLSQGTPVALIDIPAIDLHAVVAEGTTSRVLLTGPGHRRDTPLPGQSGSSVIFGRQGAYGGLFAHLGALAIGDKITATTGLGTSTYTVTGLRRTGDPLPAQLSAGEGRLTLVSADGIPFLPTTIIRVDAKLTTPAQASPGRVFGYPALDVSELTMAGDPSALPIVVLLLIGLAIALTIFTISARYWGMWQTWIVAVPVLFALGCFAAQEATVLLPNLL